MSTWQEIDNGGNPSEDERKKVFIDVIMKHTLPPDEIFAYVFLKNKRAHFMALTAPAADLRTEMGARLRKFETMNIDLRHRGKGIVRVHFYEEY